MKVAIDEKIVDKIASLAKLEFEGEEKQRIIKDMNNMLNFIDKLEEINTDGISPLIHMTDEDNTFRADVSKIEITQKEALSNAPKKDSTYFKIPKVME
jgi:aspartyl-tRNA(Asn)/glutamyl-tRNA(Gln) amidotransferase subunit C